MNPMNYSMLNHQLFLIKEHIGLFKAANNFDIYDPISGETLMYCREEKLGFFTKMFRFTKYKMMTPFHVEVRGVNGAPVLSLTRKSSFWGFKSVHVFNEHGKLIGTMNRKFRIGGAKLELNDAHGNMLGILKGNFIGWDFKISNDEQELAIITKKWAGIGKELFTSADNYMLEIHNSVPQNDSIRILMVGAVLCIDFLLKE